MLKASSLFERYLRSNILKLRLRVLVSSVNQGAVFFIDRFLITSGATYLMAVDNALLKSSGDYPQCSNILKLLSVCFSCLFVKET